VAVSIGSTMAIVGVVVNIPLAVVGLVITFIAIMLWVRDAREEMAALPLDHHAGPGHGGASTPRPH
jgi:hypothetical protein